MIDRAHDLPITRQAEALNISRGSVDYLPRPVSSIASGLACSRSIPAGPQVERSSITPSAIPESSQLGSVYRKDRADK